MDAIHLFHRAGQTVDMLAAEALAKSTMLTPRQYVCLKAISDGAVNNTEVVAKTGIDRSTVADIMRRLVERGLCKRSRSTVDQRAYETEITAKGETSLKKGHEALTGVTQEIMSATTTGPFLNNLALIVKKFGPIDSAKTSKRDWEARA